MNNPVDDFSVQRAGNTITVAGALTIATANEVLVAAAGCFSDAERTLDVDLSALQKVDSAALAVLLEWLRLAARRNQQLAFCNVPGRLKQLAQISELDEVLGFRHAG